MRARRLDRWFDRYRRRGDVGALARVFDETAPELYRVAVHIARDLHTAEDLVQATFLAAIESREAYDERRELLPWLLGILARKAAEERRRARRAIEPDRIESREAEDPARAIESAELSADLESALARMESPYREVLEAHLRGGKSPQEIALVLGRAPGTVRVQLHRGLEHLRRALPASLALGGTVAVAPRGLDAVRTVVVGAGRRATAPISTGTAAAGLVGGIVMSTKAWIGAGAVLFGLTWLGWRTIARGPPSQVDVSGPTGSVEGPGGPTESVAPNLAVSEPRLDPERVPATRSASVETSAPRAPSACSVSGRLDLASGAPAVGAHVVLFRMVEGVPRDAVVEGRTGADGSFRFESEPGPCLVVGLVDGVLPLAIETELLPSTEVKLDPATFSPGAHIRGRVRFNAIPAPAGCQISTSCAIEGVRLSIGDQDLEWSDRRLLVRDCGTRSDADGRFAIEAIEPRVQRVVVDNMPGARIFHAEQDVLAPADGLELDFDSARVIVRTESDGEPLPSHIFLTEEGPASGGTWGFGGTAVAEALVLPDTVLTVRAVREGFIDSTLELVAPAAGGTLERVVELVRAGDSAELLVDLLTPTGVDIDRAGFGLLRVDGDASDLANFSVLARRKPDVVRDESGKDNRFRLRALPPGRYELIVNAGGTWAQGSGYWHHDPVEIELTSGGTVETRVDLQLGGRVRVRCANQRGAWLPARCQIIDSSGAEIPASFVTRNEHGVWLGHGSLNASAPEGKSDAYPNLPPGKYQIRFSREGYRTESRTVTIEAGRTIEVEVVLEDE